MARPSIALCMIVKNEAHNLSGLLQSVKGCFDEIHITDTGSTDNTLEFIEKINQHIETAGSTDNTPEFSEKIKEHIETGSEAWRGFPRIQVHQFEWCDDFAKARNYSFSFAKSDYLCWLDGDDLLSDPKAFIRWRDTVMHSAHYWVAIYNYVFGPNGDPECQFIRERVIKRDHGFKWEYPVHEGLTQQEGRIFWPQRVNTWTVNHRRTDEDKKGDHLRNVKIMEKLDLEKCHPRMKFYYGKELVENGFAEKGSKPLMDAAKAENIDIHDRLLAIQYAAQAAFQCGAAPQAIDLLYNGLKIMPSRAEYWCLVGDINVAKGEVRAAILAYKSALNCEPDTMGGIVVTFGPAYKEYPNIKLADIYLGLGAFAKAEPYLDTLKALKSSRFEVLMKKYEQTKDLSTLRADLPKIGDVIITCPPAAVTADWDELTLKEKGHGGSETACIEVAKWIKLKTGRRVKVFHQRKSRSVMPSGVEYIPHQELVGYLHNVEPYAHIAWRHAVRLTHAPSYVWCHDLQCLGAEKAENYEKIVALSQFHKDYLIETNGVKPEKIVLGFNGISPQDFEQDVNEKDPLKVVFSSSPDRGLIQSIDIVKKAREISGLDIKLHCFYGFENMRKGGMNDRADQIEKKIQDNPFVVSHGNVSKKVLMRHFLEAGTWLYPADFIETFCITAWEALSAGTWPIVRAMGALPYTMKEAIDARMCDITDVEVKDEASIGIWANLLVDAILEKKWTRITFDREAHSWEKVADFFIKLASLDTPNIQKFRETEGGLDRAA